MPEFTGTDVYEFVTHGICITEEWITRWFYGGAGPSVDLSALIDSFVANCLTPLIPVMHGATIVDQVNVQQVKGGVQFLTKAIAINGSVSGDGMPPYVAWDFTILRDGARERNGYKRIAGVAESQQAFGVATLTAHALLDTAASTMSTDITDGTQTFEPVIQRKFVNHLPKIPPVYYTVSNVRYSKVGSQNSRKFGHGR